VNTPDDTLDEALAELAPRLFRFALGRTGCRSLAEDVAQEALAALVKSWRERPPENPAAFVFAIARRRAARATWKQRLLAPLEAVLGREAPQPDPEETAINRERGRRCLDGLAELGSRDREALLLVAAGDVDQGTAAALLGLSTAAFKMRLHRARKRLAQALEESP
jgi:RNA polymerase sigma-70 factor (ECF subfamily)